MARALSDAELRAELTRLGAAPGPITATTRYLWEKKLEKLLSSAEGEGGTTTKAKKAKAGSRAAAGASSTKTAETSVVSLSATTGGESEVKKRGRGRPPSSPSSRGQQRTRTPPRKKTEASDSEEADDLNPPKGRAPVIEEVRSSARNRSPVKKSSSDLIPGEMNLSRNEPPPSPKKAGESVFSLSALLSRGGRSDTSRGVVNDSLGYSDSDNDESPLRVDRSLNTSFLPPVSSYSSSSARRSPAVSSYSPPGESVGSYSYLNRLGRRSIADYGVKSEERSVTTRRTILPSYGKLPDPRPPVFQPQQREQKSSSPGVVESLNRFRHQTVERIKQAVYGKPPQPEFDHRQSDIYSSRKLEKRDGDWRLRGSYESKVNRSLSVHVSDNTSKIIVGALLAFLIILALGYLGSAYRVEAKAVFTVVSAAAKDTASFIYSHMILPILAVSFVVAVVLAVYWYQKYKTRKNAERRTKVFEMIDRIIGILRKHHIEETKSGRTADNETCLSVPHIRDMLISPAERKELFPIWVEAEKYVSENESRVQCEVQLVGGQNCMVWRWVQPHGTFEDEKQWQGHAFPEDQVRLNAPVNPYSECLKLRGMFDPDL